MSARSADLTEKWYEYVYRDRAESVRRFLDDYPDERALAVGCEQFGHDYRFLRPLLANPDEALRAGTDALGRFLADDADRDLGDVYLRVSGLPAESEVALADLRADHLNTLCTIHGEVREVGSVAPKVIRAGFRCAKCEEVTRHAVQRDRKFQAHAKCPRCKSVGYLSFAPSASEYVDAQEIALSDPEGSTTVTTLLEHDLTGEVSDGEEVRLVGIPRASRADGTTVADVWIESVSME